jgi:putative DNA primase/helicase
MTEHVLPPPSEPLKVARELVDDRFRHGDALTLRHWRGGFWRWETTRWAEVEQRAMSAQAYEFTEDATYEKTDS